MRLTVYLNGIPVARQLEAPPAVPSGLRMLEATVMVEDGRRTLFGVATLLVDPDLGPPDDSDPAIPIAGAGSGPSSQTAPLSESA